MTDDGDRGPTAPRFSVAAASDPGQQRQNNEDGCVVLRVSGDGTVPAEGEVELGAGETLLLLVADGMGGAAGGEVASSLALETIGQEIDDGYDGEELAEKEVGDLLCSALGAANEVIFDEAAERSNLKGMGTTLTGAWVFGDVAHIVQIGDSRAYLYRAGRLKQLTQDQTLVEHLVTTGKLSRQEAETAKDRNVILQALGVRPDIEPVLSTVFLHDGDTLFLCSDGLNAVLDNDQIELLMEQEGDDVPGAVKRLVDEANAGGGPDNVTVAMLRVGGPFGDAGELAEDADLVDTQEVPVMAAPELGDTQPQPVMEEWAEPGTDGEPEDDGAETVTSAAALPEKPADRRDGATGDGTPDAGTAAVTETVFRGVETIDVGEELGDAGDDDTSGIDPRAVRWLVVGFVAFASTASLLILMLR